MQITADGQANTELLLAKLGFDNTVIKNVDVTDGLRLVLDSDDIVYLRHSGNAAKLRCYSESTRTGYAKFYVNKILGKSS